jgi:hypothetical protein
MQVKMPAGGGSEPFGGSDELVRRVITDAKVLRERDMDFEIHVRPAERALGR